MPRGRPKGSKNKSKITTTPLFTADLQPQDTAEKEPEAQVSAKIPSVNKQSYYTCMICEQQRGGGPIVVNLSLSFGRANYYRETKPDRLHICPECANELNKLVDSWILKQNPKLSKFPLSS